MKQVALFAAFVLCFVGPHKQQTSQEPNLTSHKVAAVSIRYSKESRVGQILFSNTEERFEQYFDVWGKSPKDYTPVVITYVFDNRDKEGRFYTATWGKGPIERAAFNSSCLASVPDFTDDVYWAAKVIDGKVQFEQLEDTALKEGVVKVLFRSVKGSIQRWVFESARPVISQAPYDDQRILTDLVNREQNRKIWYTKGWLRPENRCVRYLRSS